MNGWNDARSMEFPLQFQGKFIGIKFRTDAIADTGLIA